MQTVEFSVSEKNLNEYVTWAKNSAVLGEKTKEFEFNGVVFFDAAHISLIQDKSDPTVYIAKLHCDHVERKRK
jgi:hypothetical protein